MQYDENLRNLRFQYVPKRMKEQEFWRRYFIAVRNIKHEFLDIESETGSDATLSTAENKSSQTASDVDAEVFLSHELPNSQMLLLCCVDFVEVEFIYM